MARILVVDDIPCTHRLLSLMLRRTNHTTITAESGQQALEQLEKVSVDLIITDLNMPEMDGYTLMEQVRAKEEFKDLPIIVMTASYQEQGPTVAAQKGATHFMTQPISSSELNRVVTECLALVRSQLTLGVAGPH